MALKYFRVERVNQTYRGGINKKASLGRISGYAEFAVFIQNIVTDSTAHPRPDVSSCSKLCSSSADWQTGEDGI
ncbi:MAG: hypothetical protein ACRC6R_06460 [Bacteroidales bacterium]